MVSDMTRTRWIDDTALRESSSPQRTLGSLVRSASSLVWVLLLLLLIMMSYGHQYSYGVMATSWPEHHQPKQSGPTLSMSHTHSCWVSNNGTIMCYGISTEPYMPQPPPYPPYTESTGWRGVAAGNGVTCGIAIDSHVKCWGYESNILIPPPGVLFTMLEAATNSDKTMCGITLEGAITCFGDVSKMNPPLVDNAVAVAMASGFGCALLDDGSITCWGVIDSKSTPPPVINDGVAIKCMVGDCCVLRGPTRFLTCWGTTPRATYGAVTDEDIRAFGLTNQGGCALFRNTSLVCWGGMAHQPDYHLPAYTNSSNIVAGTYGICAISDDGIIDCWGNNVAHQMSPPPRSITITRLPSNAPLTLAGWGMDSDGHVYATSPPWNKPWYPPPVGIQAIDIASDGPHACALLINHTITCWGQVEADPLQLPPNYPLVQQFTLGIQFSCGRTLVTNEIMCHNETGGVVDLPGVMEHQWQHMCAGQGWMCALNTTGYVTCWPIAQYVPNPDVLRPPVHHYSQLACGYEHACGLLMDDNVPGRSRGDVECWGNGFNQGDASAVNLTTIVPGPYTHVYAGGFVSCGRIANGTIVCQGARDWLPSIPSTSWSTMTMQSGSICGIPTESHGGVVCVDGLNSRSPARRMYGYFDRVITGNPLDWHALTSPRQVITTCGASGMNGMFCGMYPMAPCGTLAFAMSRTSWAQGYVTYRIEPSTVYTLTGAILLFPGVTLESTDAAAQVEIDCKWAVCVTAAANDVAFTRLNMWHGLPAIVVRSEIALVSITECTISRSSDGGERMGSALTILFGAEVYIRQSYFFDLYSVSDGGAIFTSFASLLIDDTSFYNCSTGGNGGAIYAYNTEVRLRGVSVIGSTAMNGAAISMERGQFTALMCAFQDNSAIFAAGALYLKTLTTLESSWLDLILCVDNVAAYGGGVYVENTALDITDSYFEGNKVYGRPDSMGGGIAAVDTRLVIIGTTFFNNRVQRSLRSSDAPTNITSSVSVPKEQHAQQRQHYSKNHRGTASTKDMPSTPSTTFVDTTKGGAAIACVASSYPQLTRIMVNKSTITYNYCEHDGGAIYLDSCPMSLTTSLLAHNEAIEYAGVMMVLDSPCTITHSSFVDNRSRYRHGGVIVALESPTTFSECEFMNNTALTGGGACFFAQGRQPTVTNCQFTMNHAKWSTGSDIATPPHTLKLISPAQWSNHTSGEPLDPPVKLILMDENGHIVTSDERGQSLAVLDCFASVPYPAILGGALSVAPEEGIFAFNGTGSSLVLIGRGQQGYKLRFLTQLDRMRGNVVVAYDYLNVGLKLCEPGEFQSIERCIQCAPGFYSAKYNESTCERCPAGKYAEVSMGASSCSDCPLGSAANSDGRFGADGCISCDPGFYANATGSTICSSCEPGRYSYKNGTYGSSQCYECAAGRYQPASGQSFCRDAPVGQFVPDVAATQPIPCPKFSHQSETGQTACEACPLGSFTDGTGAIECTTCGSGEYMTRTGGGGILSRNITCRQCPKGGDCPGIGVVSAKEGYFLAVQDGGIILSFPCLSPSQCIGGAACLNTSDDDTSMVAVDSGVTVTCCGPNRYSGSGNPLCGLCLPGHSEWGGKCVACSEPNVPILLLYIFAAFIFMVAFHAVSQSTRADTRLFFYFVQMMLLFIGPEPWINWLTIFNLNPLSSTGTCVTPIKPINQLILGVVVPLALVFTLLFMALMDLLSWWYARRQLEHHARMEAQLAANHLGGLPPPLAHLTNNGAPSSPTAAGAAAANGGVSSPRHNSGRRTIHIWRVIANDRLKFFKTPYIRTTAALFAFGYNSMSQSVFRYFNCVELRGQKWRVVASVPAVNCDEDDYRSYSVFFWILLSVVLIATPIGLLIGLCVSNKRRLLSDPKHISRYGVLFETYNARCYYWEFILFLRRSVLVGLSVLLYSNRTQMLAWITFANVIILFLHVWQWPYKKPIDNYVETILLTTLSLLSAILASFSTVTQTFEVYQKVIVSMLSVLPSCCLMLLIIYNRRVAIMQKLYFICGCLCRARADAFERQYGKAAAANDAISMTSPANHHYGGDYTSITSRRTISTISNASQQPLIIACEDECDGGIAVVECLDCDADHRRCHACDHTYHRGSRRYHKRIAIHDGDETTRAISSANAAVLEVRRHSAANAHLAPMLSHLHHRSVNGGGGHHRTGSNASSSHAVMNDSKRQGPFTTPLLGATSSRINHSGTPPSLIIDEDSFPSITTTTTTTNIESPRLHPAPTPAPAPVTASPVMTSSTTIGGHRARTISIASMGSIQDL